MFSFRGQINIDMPYKKAEKKVKQEIRLEEKNPFRSINIMKDIFTVCDPRISAQLPCFTGIDCKRKQ